MQIQTLTFEQLIVTVAVILICVGVYNTIMSAIKTHREEKRRREQPVSTLETQVQEHEEKLKRDYQRLNTLDESSRLTLKGLMALLSHEINGNSDDKLRQSYEEIQTFLIGR